MLLPLFVSCRLIDPAPSEPVAPQDTAVESAPAVRFEPLGAERLEARIEARSYVFSVASVPLTDGASWPISVDWPLAEAEPPCLAELDAILAALDDARAERAPRDGSAPSPAASPAGPTGDAGPAGEGPPAGERDATRYELHVAAGWIADLRILEVGDDDALVELRTDDSGPAAVVVHAPAPLLLRTLRARALEALLAHMARPRRATVEQHVALASFLDGSGPTETQLGQARGVLRRFLCRAADPSPVARALFAHLDRFDDAEFVTAFGDSQQLSLRLLALAQDARRGNLESLREILTLSFEFHGDTELFVAAVRALFPRDANARLYESHPVSSDGAGATAFLDAVREQLPAARRDGQSRWTIPDA